MGTSTYSVSPFMIVTETTEYQAETKMQSTKGTNTTKEVYLGISEMRSLAR
jgi:hypothetical protein